MTVAWHIGCSNPIGWIGNASRQNEARCDISA
jgi:hypothetical protein